MSSSRPVQRRPNSNDKPLASSVPAQFYSKIRPPPTPVFRPTNAAEQPPDLEMPPPSPDVIGFESRLKEQGGVSLNDRGPHSLSSRLHNSQATGPMSMPVTSHYLRDFRSRPNNNKNKDSSSSTNQNSNNTSNTQGDGVDQITDQLDSMMGTSWTCMGIIDENAPTGDDDNTTTNKNKKKSILDNNTNNTGNTNNSNNNKGDDNAMDDDNDDGDDAIFMNDMDD